MLRKIYFTMSLCIMLLPLRVAAQYEFTRNELQQMCLMKYSQFATYANDKGYIYDEEASIAFNAFFSEEVYGQLQLQDMVARLIDQGGFTTVLYATYNIPHFTSLLTHVSDDSKLVREEVPQHKGDGNLYVFRSGRFFISVQLRFVVIEGQRVKRGYITVQTK